MPSTGIQHDRLEELVTNSSHVIFTAKTARLFDLSPDIITICPNRITITYGSLFNTVEYPLPIENVIGARINNGILYSTLYIETFGYERPKPISFLLKKEARLARRYILALVECSKNKVDLSSYPLTDLREKLKLIGMVRHSASLSNN